MSRGLLRKLTAFLLLHTLWPALVLAQQPAAGVVTALQGQATVARPVIPQPIPLRYKDDVFLRDRINTPENSIVRVLLGGKALVTVRELSVLTITEEPGRAVVDLQVGKVAVGVARRLLKPGDSIEVRTPNAVASVRGSYLVAAVAITAGIPRSTFTTLNVTVPVTVSPRADPTITIPLGNNQSLGVTGVGAATGISGIQAITPAQRTEAAQVGAAPKPPETTEKPPEQASQNVAATQVQVTTALAEQLAPPSGGGNGGRNGGGPPTASACPPSCPIPEVRQPVIPDGPYFLVDKSDLQLPTGVSLALFYPGPGAPATSRRDTISDDWPPPGNPSVAGRGPTITAFGQVSDDGRFRGPVIELRNSRLTSSEASLLSVSGTNLLPFTLLSLTPDPKVPASSTTLTLKGSLLSLDSAATLTSSDPVVTANTSTINATGGGPLVSASSSTLQVTGPGKGLLSLDHSTLTASGALLDSASSATTIGDPTALGPLVQLANGSTLQVSAGPVARLNGGSLTADTLVKANGTGNTISLTGTFLDLTGAQVSLRTLVDAPGNTLTLTSATGQPFVNVAAGSSLTTSGDLVSLSGGSLTTTGSSHLVSLSGGSLSLGGALVSLTGSPTVSIGGDLLHVASTVTGPASTSLVSVGAGTLAVTGDLVEVGTGSTLTLSRPLLTVSGGSASAGRVLNLNAPMTTPSGQPLLQVSGGSLSVVGTLGTTGHLVTIPGSVSLTVGGKLLDLGGSGHAETAQALVNVEGILALSDSLVDVGGTATLETQGLATVSPGGQVQAPMTGPNAAVAAIGGGSHTIATAGEAAMFRLSGRDSPTTVETIEIEGNSLTLGTDRPLRGAMSGATFPLQAALVDVSQATVSTRQALRLDTALLEASKPLLKMSGGSMTSANDLVTLVQKAKVTANVPSDALVQLRQGGTLTVSNGSLFNVAGGSSLSITGSLFSLNNGSTINITNGGLLTVSGGSVFSLTGGSLGTFGAGKNTLNLTNTAALCGGCSLTTSITNFNFPVLLKNSASASNVMVNAGFVPFSGLSGNNKVNVTGTSGAVLVLDGASSKVKLGF